VVCCSLGHLNYDEAFLGVFQVFKHPQSSNKRIEASQFSMAMFEHKTSAQIGEGLTCAKSLQNASLAAETTGGEILVPFWPKHVLRSNFKVKKFFWGACSQTPLVY